MAVQISYTHFISFVGRCLLAVRSKDDPGGPLSIVILITLFLLFRNEKLLADPVRLRQISERIPAGRWGQPKDFAGPVVFLASSASQYVCGELLVVDGVSGATHSLHFNFTSFVEFERTWLTGWYLFRYLGLDGTVVELGHVHWCRHCITCMIERRNNKCMRVLSEGPSLSTSHDRTLYAFCWRECPKR